MSERKPFLCRVGLHQWSVWHCEASDWWRMCRRCRQVQQVADATPVGKREEMR